MNMEIIKQLAILIIGFALLVKGADLFVDGASGIAKKFGISELIIGLTIVAMGTSAPEAAVSIAAAAKGSAGISIGNVIGSNIMNIFIILGVVAAITPLKIERSTVRYEMPFTIIVTVLFVLMGRDGLITRVDGAILWAGLLLYIAYLLRQAKQKPAEIPSQAETAVQKTEGTDSPEVVVETAANVPNAAAEAGATPAAATETGEAVPAESPSIWKLIALTIVGLAVILVSSDYAVDAAVALAKIFNISDRVIGLTIVALGTSLPELVTSVTAALRGNADLAVGNVVGSCIFNLLFVLGTSALILPIPCAPNFLSDAYVAVGATVLLLLFGFTQMKIVRWEGVLLVACYVAYAYVALV
ncbi:cation:H+ antiporter [Succiniclasticum ruminis]|uniref:Cation:H+ antiporter n=1 Tax=Succiniclasticum ruminis TaxID=40841 RepID=A0A1G6HL38_9FIRM|nr:calcium/sodium antiporter [Succiniclasticum ruminis]SDB94828.1 cation:H+ antiporter [Succiniclasticum ruminis]